uniref:Uncharacterized protein n=1 Tax=Arundo donax TaxID=35708 RepID=A0A0A9GV79_ARUDO
MENKVATLHKFFFSR